MMNLIVILCGIFALACSYVITIIRFCIAVLEKGEEIPVNDKMKLMRLWYDYMNDEL